MGQVKNDDGLEEDAETTVPTPANTTAAPAVAPTADKPAEAAPVEAVKPESAPVTEPKK
jgi:hypothetical protein